MDKKLQQIVSQFRIQREISDIAAFGNGHINDIYIVKIKSETIPDYVLQRARSQFRLVAEIGKHEAEMEEIVAGLA